MALYLIAPIYFAIFNNSWAAFRATHELLDFIEQRQA